MVFSCTWLKIKYHLTPDNVGGYQKYKSDLIEKNVIHANLKACNYDIEHFD